MSGNASVFKSMRLETSDDSTFFFQVGILSIFSLVVARTYGLPSGLIDGVDEFKGGSLTDFDGTDAEGP